MSDVFVLGAGFSRAVSEEMPLTADLFDPCINAMPQVLGDADGELVAAFTRFDKNLETWLTWLASEHPWLDEPSSLRHRATFAAVSHAIAGVILGAQNNVLRQFAEGPPDWLSELVAVWAAADTTVITFNYDALVEKAFEASTTARARQLYIFQLADIPSPGGEYLAPTAFPRQQLVRLAEAMMPRGISNVTLPYPYGATSAAVSTTGWTAAPGWGPALRGEHFADVDDLTLVKLAMDADGTDQGFEALNELLKRSQLVSLATPEDRFDLLKLHGSVNWCVLPAADGDDRVFDTELAKGWGLRLSPAGVQPGVAQIDDETELWQRLGRRQPFIIPPVLSKDPLFTRPQLRDQWVRAHGALAQASRIFFLGYSLPDADLAARFLLQNANDDATVIVANRNGAAVERIKKGMAPRDVDERYACAATGISECAVDYAREQRSS